MEGLGNILKKISISDAVDEDLKYIDDRRKGLISSLKTKFPRLDNYLLGGIELNTILCIGAMSGAGKSTLAKCIRDSIYENNPSLKFNQYCFNFEMLCRAQISRSVVSSSNTSLKRLYSVEEPLTDYQFDELKVYYNKLKEREGVWFIETPGTAREIVASLWHYYLKECKPFDKVLIYELDHTLLTSGRQGATEKERIDELMLALVAFKKKVSADGGNSVGLVLSQFNRLIRDKDRVQNKDMHRPGTECLFGASSIEQACDYVLLAHIPAKLNITSYTTRNLPTRMRIGDAETGKWVQIPYFELVKQRSGESDLTIPMWNKLHRFDFDEMDIEIFRELQSEFKEKGTCTITEQQKIMYGITN